MRPRPQSAAPLRDAILLLGIALAAACGGGEGDDASIVRGRGLKPANLPVAAEARVYEAAIQTAFDVDPSLVLLMHPRRLPRTEGYATGDSVPTGLVRALRDRGIVRGTCNPRRDSEKDTPRCSIPEAGYIVRGSDVLRVARDTVRLYFAAEKFGAATGQKPEALRFEKIYELAGRGTSWRVVREARATWPW
jgi:hypothetical protein